MQIMSDCWFLAVVAFGLGLLTGRIVWAQRQTKHEASSVTEVSNDQQDKTQIPHEPTPNGQDDILDALASELENAQKMLEAGQAESNSYGDILGDLDEAVKRANGRLKLIAKSIKRQ